MRIANKFAATGLLLCAAATAWAGYTDVCGRVLINYSECYTVEECKARCRLCCHGWEPPPSQSNLAFCLQQCDDLPIECPNCD